MTLQRDANVATGSMQYGTSHAFTLLLMATVFILSHLNCIHELRISGGRFISMEHSDTDTKHFILTLVGVVLTTPVIKAPNLNYFRVLRVVGALSVLTVVSVVSDGK